MKIFLLYEGWAVKGKVEKTIVGGEIRFEA